MKLYFRNSKCKDRLIAKCSTYEDVTSAINRFLDKNNYKSYYSRIWYEPSGTVNPFFIRDEGRFIFDVGSHSEFFELYVDENEINNLSESIRGLYEQESKKKVDEKE